MSIRSAKQSQSEKIPASTGNEILEFLVRELPPKRIEHAAQITDALLKAGARYDRYMTRQDEWRRYGPRTARLRTIKKLLEDLATHLSELDILSRDELASRMEPAIVTIVGSLMSLRTEITELINKAQSKGTPRNLAERQWILELADIYENAFRQPVGANQAKFRRLLEVGWPTSYHRYGKLDLRQIKRTLDSRKNAQAIETA